MAIHFIQDNTVICTLDKLQSDSISFKPSDNSLGFCYRCVIYITNTEDSSKSVELTTVQDTDTTQNDMYEKAYQKLYKEYVVEKTGIKLINGKSPDKNDGEYFILGSSCLTMGYILNDRYLDDYHEIIDPKARNYTYYDLQAAQGSMYPYIIDQCLAPVDCSQLATLIYEIERQRDIIVAYKDTLSTDAAASADAAYLAEHSTEFAGTCDLSKQSYDYYRINQIHLRRFIARLAIISFMWNYLMFTSHGNKKKVEVTTDEQAKEFVNVRMSVDMEACSTANIQTVIRIKQISGQGIEEDTEPISLYFVTSSENTADVKISNGSDIPLITNYEKQDSSYIIKNNTTVTMPGAGTFRFGLRFIPFIGYKSKYDVYMDDIKSVTQTDQDSGDPLLYKIVVEDPVEISNATYTDYKNSRRLPLKEAEGSNTWQIDIQSSIVNDSKITQTIDEQYTIQLQYCDTLDRVSLYNNGKDSV